MNIFQKWPKGIQQPFEGIERALLLVFTALAITAIMTSVVTDLAMPFNFRQGEVALYSVKSPRDFLVEDSVESNQRRKDAASGVRRVFVIDDLPRNSVSVQVDELFLSLKRAIGDVPNGENPDLSAEQRSAFERQFGVDLVGKEWAVLLNEKNWPDLKEAVTRAVDPILQRGIIANKRRLQHFLAQNGVLLKKKSDGEEQPLYSNATILDLREASQELGATLRGGRYGRGDPIGRIVYKLGQTFLQPNVVFDAAATEARIAKIEEKVATIFYKIRRGEVIVRAGDIISATQEKKLNRLKELQGPPNVRRNTAGYTALVMLIICISFFFTKYLWRGFSPVRSDFFLLSLTLIGTFLLVRSFSILGESLNVAFPDISADAFLLATPWAAGGIMLQVTLGAPGVLLFVFSFGLLASVFLGSSWTILTLIVLGNFVGAMASKQCSRRSGFLLAGAKVAMLNTVVLLLGVALTPQMSSATVSFQVLCGIFAGLVSGILGASLAPVAEYIGRYVTDIKLLELASLDRPLLRELSLQAPGTWNHSMVIGQMAEAAAEAIGANALLARVGAYYHDIGKIKKPDYFVENQKSRENRHTKLTPHMSALIIRAHVKDGIEMARQHKLPKVIEDFIPQHHGTSLMEFFYDKAKNEAEEDEEVQESRYRYPGPKPQTKEAGILMLADQIEAASRTLSDQTPAKIQGLVQKIVNKVFSSGQIDESELTLKDLHLIAKSFIRVLTGIYHRRIEYSEPAEKTSQPKTGENGASANGEEKAKSDEARQVRDGSRSAGEGAREKAPRESSPRKGNGSDSKESLKRLGMEKSGGESSHN